MTTPDDGGYDPGAHLSFSDIAVDDPTSPSFLQSENQAVQDRPVPQRGRSVPRPHGFHYLSRGSPFGLPSV